MTKSKFGALLDAAKRAPESPEPQQEKPKRTRSRGEPARPAEDEAVPEQKPKRGRPRGKRSDPAFESVTAYIRRDTHLKVKMELLRRGGRKEFSELVEELLVEWLAAGASKN